MNKSFWSVRCPSLREFSMFSPSQVSFFESLVDENGYPSPFLKGMLGRDVHNVINPSYIHSFILHMNKLGHEINLTIFPIDKQIEGKLSIKGVNDSQYEWGSLWYCIEKLEEWYKIQ